MSAAKSSGRSMETTPLETFLDLAADHRVVPVTRKVLADSETPLSAYRKLARDIGADDFVLKDGTFLLESAPNGASWSRWSFIGAGTRSALTVADGQAHWWGDVPAGAPVGGDPVAALAESLRLLQTDPLADMPPLTGGFVGFMAYDFVRRLERLPETTVDDLHLPDMFWLLVADLAAFDHHEGTITLIANAVNWNGTAVGKMTVKGTSRDVNEKVSGTLTGDLMTGTAGGAFRGKWTGGSRFVQLSGTWNASENR